MSSNRDLKQQTTKQRLAYATCAIALVCSLVVYKRDVMANPLSVVQKHFQAIAAEDIESTAKLYDEKAVLKRSHGIVDEVYQGESISLAWKKFFSIYEIEDFQVVQQKRRDRTVEAQIEITVKSKQGIPVVLSIFYQANFDHTGKIMQEVWQSHPEYSI